MILIIYKFILAFTYLVLNPGGTTAVKHIYPRQLLGNPIFQCLHYIKRGDPYNWLGVPLLLDTFSQKFHFGITLCIILY